MAAPLHPTIAAEMKAQADAIRDRQAAASNFTKSWSLSGQKAIVEPGKSVLARLLPRWDIADSMVTVGDKRVPNSDYKPQRAYVMAFEHWWTKPDGKRTREFCPQTLDPKALCAVCLSSRALLGSAVKEDRDLGKDIRQQKVYIFNAVVGAPRIVGEDKLVDIRILSLDDSKYRMVSDIMTGGEREQFARGDITHPVEGYDLLLKRPVKNSGERWDVDVAPNPSRLYGPDQASAFKGWSARLINLEEMLEREVKDSNAIFRAYYGRDPEPGELGSVESSDTEPERDDDPQAETAQQASAAEPEGPDDEFMGLMPPRAPAPKGAQSERKAGPPAVASVAPKSRAPRR